MIIILCFRCGLFCSVLKFRGNVRRNLLAQASACAAVKKSYALNTATPALFSPPVGVANSNLKHLPTPDAPVWFPTKGHHQPTVDYLKSVSSFKAAYLMIRKLRKEKYIQRAYGNMPLVGDQATAFTGVAVGLRMN